LSSNKECFEDFGGKNRVSEKSQEQQQLFLKTLNIQMMASILWNIRSAMTVAALTKEEPEQSLWMI